MELPKRPKQHISESRSYKIFHNNIPDEWIIRETSEKDYGIDCYIEIVDNEELKGKLIPIQIKSKEKIPWNKHNEYSFSKINISTTNYWYLFPIPVFVCLVDLHERKVYFLSVKKYVRENFNDYLNKKNFSYVFQKNQVVDINEGLQTFQYQYYFDSIYEFIIKDIIGFVSNFDDYIKFINGNIGRDSFLGVEWSRLIYINNIYNILHSLSYFFGIEWDLDEFDSYKNQSQEKYGDEYKLYEEHMSKLAKKMRVKMKPLLLAIRTFICETESVYWLSRDSMLSNYLYNCCLPHYPE
jgi:hypothetical protein